MNRTALITGITGQDGSYLAELLIEKGYDVHGIIRRTSSFATGRIEHLYHDPHQIGLPLTLHYGDLTDSSALMTLIHRIRPDEIYNLGAQSHVAVSFDMPEFTTDVVAMGNLRLLEAISIADWNPRFYQAGSSEMFGKVLETPQSETTPFYPRSPYAVAKVCAHYMTVQYREARGLFACNGILFNHESPRRGGTFVTRKVTRGIAQILAGDASKIYLGNLDARRDWGYAREYVDAMWRMLQHDTPDDYVIATGATQSVRDLVDTAFSLVDRNWQDYVEIDPRYFRPTEVDILLGDPAKAKHVLGWEATTTFHDLVRLMLASDLRDAGIDLTPYPQLRDVALDTPKPVLAGLNREEFHR